MTTVKQQPVVSPSPANSAIAGGQTKPPLQQALEALTINLDEELMRYRRSRFGDEVPPVPTAQLKLRQRRRRRSLNLITLKGQEPKATTSTAGVTTQGVTAQNAVDVAAGGGAPAAVPPYVPENPRLRQILEHSATPDSQVNVPQGTHQAITQRGGAMMPYQVAPDSYMASTEVLLDSLPDDTYADREDVDYHPSWRDQLSTPLGLGLLLLLLLGSASFGYLVTTPEMARRFWDNPLVQALRGSENDEMASEGEPTEGDMNVADDVETGLRGIGPDLSQSEFQELELGRISTLSADVPESPSALPEGIPDDGERESALAANRANASPTESNPRTSTEPVSPVNPRPQPSPMPTVVAAPQPRATTAPAPRTTVTPQPQPTAPPVSTARPAPSPRVVPQPAAAPSAATTPPPPLATNPAPQPLPAVETTPPTTAVGPSTTAAPAPVSQSPPDQSNHYVVTDYTGDQSLDSARQAVGDAYVRNFPDGARIQMGSFSQETAAEDMVQELQNQGIPAQVYNP
jgi:hypothetical protein